MIKKLKKGGLSIDRLREVLDYSGDTGIFRWKIKKSWRTKIGDIAGYVGTRGYRRISIDNTEYYEHLLAWYISTGSIPNDQIDHINKIRGDNRISNLREADNSENINNCNKYKTNKSGYKGVSWRKKDKKWVAQIQINKKKFHLGLFATPLEASRKYEETAKRTHGEFYYRKQICKI